MKLSCVDERAKVVMVICETGPALVARIGCADATTPFMIYDALAAPGKLKTLGLCTTTEIELFKKQEVVFVKKPTFQKDRNAHKHTGTKDVIKIRGFNFLQYLCDRPLAECMTENRR